MFKKLIASVMLASLALTAIVPATVSAAGGKDLAERLIQHNTPDNNGLIHVVNDLLMPPVS